MMFGSFGAAGDPTPGSCDPGEEWDWAVMSCVTAGQAQQPSPPSSLPTVPATTPFVLPPIVLPSSMPNVPVPTVSIQPTPPPPAPVQASSMGGLSTPMILGAVAVGLLAIVLVSSRGGSTPNMSMTPNKRSQRHPASCECRSCKGRRRRVRRRSRR